MAVASLTPLLSAQLHASFSLGLARPLCECNKRRLVSHTSWWITSKSFWTPNIRHQYEEEIRTTAWLQKLNSLDFSNRTRAFFSELRKRQNVAQKAGPIIDCSGTLSDNFDDTLKNWTEYYKKLYTCRDLPIKLPTPDNDVVLDRELELSEFLDGIYSLKPHVSPGYDGLTSEDFRSLIPTESPNNEFDTEAKLASLEFIFCILENFWFNETVPLDFKVIILCPFFEGRG